MEDKTAIGTGGFLKFLQGHTFLFYLHYIRIVNEVADGLNRLMRNLL